MSTTALAVTSRLTKQEVTPQIIRFIIMLGSFTFLSKKISLFSYRTRRQKSMFSAVPLAYAVSDIYSVVVALNLMSGHFPQQAMLHQRLRGFEQFANIEL